MDLELHVVSPHSLGIYLSSWNLSNLDILVIRIFSVLVILTFPRGATWSSSLAVVRVLCVVSEV